MSTPSQYGRPSHCLWHLTDTHLVGDQMLYGTVDAVGHLQSLLAAAADLPRPDALVITGDLTDKGDPESYRRIRRLIEPIAAELGAAVIWVMGNHDSRPSFRQELLDQEPSLAPVDRVDQINGLRIVTLDTTVPGLHHGALTSAQLDWLTTVLAEPAEHGTVLAMHHPPLPSVLDIAVTVELRDQQDLAAVLAGTDVRSILAGHLHYSTFGTFAGIPVSVASATCYTQDLNVPPDTMRARDGSQSFNLVHVYPSTVLHSVSPIEAGFTIREFSRADCAAELERSGMVLQP